MSAAIRETEAGSLPDVLPIFPLAGALLLPRGRLPLNIFEPRYLHMTEDALAGDRLIGMVQPREAVGHPVPEGARVYDVGCAGRVTEFSETGDGRYLITLTGISRFAIVGEVEGRRGYRRVAVSYERFAADPAAETRKLACRKRLLAAVKAYFERAAIDIEWPDLAAVPDDALVTALATICPLEAREKQALLECPGLAERGDLLTTLLEFTTRAADDSAPPLRH